MVVAPERQSVYLQLLGTCPERTCAEIAAPMLKQLFEGYETCSVLPVPASVDEWRSEHRTARKRANRAERLGYQFREIPREEHGADIFAINTSLEQRQGRPMSRAYRVEPQFSPLPDYRCPLHAVRTYGVLDDRGTLVAYLWLYRSGELALVSSILGHGEHLDSGVMFQLVQGVIGAEIPYGGYLTYNRHDSGQDGLRWFKERCGFRPMEVQWAL